MLYKLKENIILRRYKDFFVFYDYKRNLYFKIEAIGFEIFNYLLKDLNINEICQKLAKKYKVEIKTINIDILEFLDYLFQYDVLENGLNNISNLSNINHESDDENEKQLFDLMAKKSIPFSVTIEITNDCNENCIHCYRPELIISKWNIENFENTLINLKKLGTLHIDFTGGEPFLHSNINQFIELCKKNDFVVSILTNATKIDDNQISLLASSPIRKLYISLYGANEEIHDKITNKKGSFNKTIETIKKLVKNGIPISLNCPIMNINENQVENLAKLSKELNVNCEFSFKISPSQNKNKNIEHLNSFSEDLILKNAKNPNVKLYNTLLSRFSELSEIKTTNTHYCQAGFRTITISPNGDLIPCTSIRYVMGNIFKNSFLYLWNKGKLLKKWQNEYNLINNKCANCKAFSFCEPCPANYFTKNKKFNGIDEVTCKFGNTLYSVSKSYCSTN